MRRRARRVSGAGPLTPPPSRLPSHRVNYSLTPSIARPDTLAEQIQHRILLIGDAGARPDGLERFLVRGGFQVTEAGYPLPGLDRPEHQPPDLVVFAIGAKDTRLAEAVRDLATAVRFAPTTWWRDARTGSGGSVRSRETIWRRSTPGPKRSCFRR